MESDKHISTDTKGFTLIEVLMAMAILSIGILAVASLQISAVHNNGMGNLITQATMLAQEKMESLKNTANITALTNGSDTNIDHYGESGGIFDRSWTISNPLGGSSSRQIEIAVQWSKRGINRNVILAAITRGEGL
jgi:type IV pilus assembly protein PilV